ncbi:MAG: LLM class flavin-dependent oxidoreductase [Ilumatobacteraceae bacterium]
MIVDLQLNQGAADWPRMREAVLAAEEAGFSTLWNLDHFSGAMFGADSMSECFTSLGAWAAVTRTIGLGTLVVNAVNRSAGLLAHSAATVQQVSGGRFTLGIGAGAAPGSKWAAEHDALGTRLLPTMTERHRHLADTVAEVRRILSPRRGNEFDGFPTLAEPLPVVVGANSTELARWAGENCDGVNVGHWNPQRAGIIAAAREAAVGRAFDASVWDAFSPELCDRGHPRAAEHTSIGASRLVLTVTSPPDPAAIASCARYLR